MHLAMSDLFRAKWTNAIHDEWIRNLLKNRSDLNRAQFERTRELMNRAVPDCLVEGYESLIPALALPDPDDRHVLAAAISAGAKVIVTFNGKDFPSEVLAQFGIEAQHPDEFCEWLCTLNMAAVCKALKQQRQMLRNPPQSAEQILETLERQGLIQTVCRLREFSELL